MKGCIWMLGPICVEIQSMDNVNSLLVCIVLVSWATFGVSVVGQMYGGCDYLPTGTTEYVSPETETGIHTE
jgi:hypothetical protein